MKLKYLHLLVLLIPMECFGFTLFANVTLQFANPVVPVYVIDDGSTACANGNFTEADLANYVQDATRMWNLVATSTLTLQYAGTIDPGNTDYTTGELCNWASPYPDTAQCANATKVPQVSGIYVACSTNNTASENFPQDGAYNPNILAATTMNNISGQSIVGAVVLMNTAQAGVALDGKSASEITAVVAHELGHAVGLGHSEQTHSLMYEQLKGIRTSITQDDALGVTYLYPVKFDSCGLFGTIKRIDSDDEPNNPPGFSLAIMSLGFILMFFLLAIKPRELYLKIWPLRSHSPS